MIEDWTLKITKNYDLREWEVQYTYMICLYIPRKHHTPHIIFSALKQIKLLLL